VSIEEIITVGQLGRPRGVNGEIYVTPMTDFPERFENVKEIFVSQGGEWNKMKVVSSKFVSGRPVLQFENFCSSEDAARLTNRYLGVPKSQVITPPPDSFYVFDLVGCEVYDDMENKKVGVIIDVEKFPANDAYVIRTIEGKRVSIAAVKKFVKQVDITGKKVTIDVTGLIEE
jgi:16S rRNA processing protein RimM